MDSKYVKEECGFDGLTVTEEAARCLLCHDAPCSKACPAGTNPDKFIRSVRFRNYKGAAETIRMNNALGAICSKVCPTEKYCQKGCSRSGIDRPIDIGRIQRFVTDFEEAAGMDILEKKPANGKSVGIVGSGPAALQAAVTLTMLGYKVEVYEKEKVLGGMLRYIPEYRLPNHIVDKEIERIEKFGVTFHAGVEVGHKVPLDELKAKHDAVVLAPGYSYGKMLPMFEGNNKVVKAIDFLKEVKEKAGKVHVPNNVLVVGGGDVAMDVVTTLKLLGVENVTDVVYEEFREFKASKKELEGAQKLGVTIMDGYVPVSCEGGKVSFEHRVIKAKVEVEADLIVLAVGQMPLVAGLGIELVKGEVNEGSPYVTKDPKVWVCGDIAHSAYDKTVVGGVRTGKEVAFYIDAALGGK